MSAGLTQLALAERVGVRQPTIARWERGTRSTTLGQVERRQDPAAPWLGELTRLAAMSQDERLLEAKLPLLVLMECIRGAGGDALVDGTLASLLHGMPGLPRRITLAIPAGDMVKWFAFRPPVRYAVDTDLMHLEVPRAEVPELFKRNGGGLLDTIYGVVELRLFDVRPATVPMTLHDDFTAVTLTLEVIDLPDLPPQLTRPPA